MMSRIEAADQRRSRYVRLAAEARELAAKSRSTEMREACLAMAGSWLSLASDLERYLPESNPEGQESERDRVRAPACAGSEGP